jgi:hypothetical protein
MLIVGDVVNQVPPLFPLEVNKVDEPTQSEAGPVMVPAFTVGFTDTVNDAEDPPQTLDTV